MQSVNISRNCDVTLSVIVKSNDSLPLHCVSCQQVHATARVALRAITTKGNLNVIDREYVYLHVMQLLLDVFHFGLTLSGVRLPPHGRNSPRNYPVYEQSKYPL